MGRLRLSRILCQVKRIVSVLTLKVMKDASTDLVRRNRQCQRQTQEGAAAAAAPEAGVGTLEEQERLLIVRALQAAGGNQSQAARLLRIGRDALRYKLKKHNL